MSDERGVWLYSDGLLSKWGFRDGDVLGDLLYDLKDEGVEVSGLREEHEILVALVTLYLLPVLHQRVEVEVIETTHNPIRARTVDGVNVEACTSFPYDEPTVTLTPDGVFVTVGQILAAGRG